MHTPGKGTHARAFSFPGFSLSILLQEISDLRRSIPLHVRGHMGVGIQSEPCAEVAQDAGQGLDVHAVLDGEGGEGVPQIVEPDLL